MLSEYNAGHIKQMHKADHDKISLKIIASLFSLVAGVLAGCVGITAGPVDPTRLGLALPLGLQAQHGGLARHVL